MACKVRILPTAFDELAGAVGYLACENPDAAEKLLDQWEEAFDRLEDVDVELTLSRFETLARLGYRTFKVGSYIALCYREDGDAVIAHVFHQSRDYASIALAGR